MIAAATGAGTSWRTLARWTRQRSASRPRSAAFEIRFTTAVHTPALRAAHRGVAGRLRTDYFARRVPGEVQRPRSISAPSSSRRDSCRSDVGRGRRHPKRPRRPISRPVLPPTLYANPEETAEGNGCRNARTTVDFHQPASAATNRNPRRGGFGRGRRGRSRRSGRRS